MTTTSPSFSKSSTRSIQKSRLLVVSWWDSSLAEFVGRTALRVQDHGDLVGLAVHRVLDDAVLALAENMELSRPFHHLRLGIELDALGSLDCAHQSHRVHDMDVLACSNADRRRLGTEFIGRPGGPRKIFFCWALGGHGWLVCNGRWRASPHSRGAGPTEGAGPARPRAPIRPIRPDRDLRHKRCRRLLPWPPTLIKDRRRCVLHSCTRFARRPVAVSQFLKQGSESLSSRAKPPFARYPLFGVGYARHLPRLVLFSWTLTPPASCLSPMPEWTWLCSKGSLFGIARLFSENTCRKHSKQTRPPNPFNPNTKTDTPPTDPLLWSVRRCWPSEFGPGPGEQRVHSVRVGVD